MHDTLYADLSGEVVHRYGPTVHLVGSAYTLTLLARLGSPETEQPQVSQLLKTLYTELVSLVLSRELPRRSVSTPTRMISSTPQGVYVGQVLDPSVRAVCVGIARAGTLPSQVVYETLNTVLTPKLVRQDHLLMSRDVDAAERVTGSSLWAAKVGGDVEDAFVLFPDPMGATGASLSKALSHYKTQVPGRPRKIICLNMIVTPEYLKRMTTDHPEAIIYALRLDRGLSPPDVLGTVPGTDWARERGLNEKQYIVPGAGGLGEVMNNAYV